MQLSRSYLDVPFNKFYYFCKIFLYKSLMLLCRYVIFTCNILFFYAANSAVAGNIWDLSRLTNPYKEERRKGVKAISCKSKSIFVFV